MKLEVQTARYITLSQLPQNLQEMGLTLIEDMPPSTMCFASTEDIQTAFDIVGNDISVEADMICDILTENDCSLLLNPDL